MSIIQIAVERTTAVTDALLALLGAGGIVYLRRMTQPSARRRIWLLALTCLGLAGALGTIVHGIAMSAALKAALWHPLSLLLGGTAASFLLGAVVDWRGDAAARRVLPAMLGLGVVFYLADRLTPGSDWALGLFGAAALAFLFATYCRIAVTRRLSGAGHIAVGFGLGILAGALQAVHSLSVRFIWEFDHNGVFHLIQLVALPIQLRGFHAMELKVPAIRG